MLVVFFFYQNDYGSYKAEKNIILEKHDNFI